MVSPMTKKMPHTPGQLPRVLSSLMTYASPMYVRVLPYLTPHTPMPSHITLSSTEVHSHCAIASSLSCAIEVSAWLRSWLGWG